MATPQFDPLTTTAVELQHLLQDGKITSVQIVETYLRQIEKFDQYVNAFISVAPRDLLLKKAAALDAERDSGTLRGPFHGIPIVLKDSIMTDPELGMPTTVGSWVFAEARCKGNSPLAQKLVDAGLLLLGKTNLTENCGFKTTWIMPGWSAYGGQTLSPYVGSIEEGSKVLGHSAPGGSSAGSAVAVATGFSPLSIGTETIGSIMVPASRAALYALKPTIGSFDMEGIFSLCHLYDSAGPMAKSPADLVPVLEALLGRSFSDALQKDWSAISVGFLDPKKWGLDEVLCSHSEGTLEQMLESYEEAVNKIKGLGGSVQSPIEAPPMSELTVDGKQVLMPLSFWDFKNNLIPAFAAGYEKCPVSTLADIVKFNEENKEKALPEPFPDQGDLVKALDDTMTPEEAKSTMKAFREKAVKLIDAAFDAAGVDIIAGPSDGGLLIHGAAAGYPTANVPLGTLQFNGRPYGLNLLAKAGNEEALLRFMSAHEATFPARPTPDLAQLPSRVKGKREAKEA